jgi:hypothetical protein
MNRTTGINRHRADGWIAALDVELLEDILKQELGNAIDGDAQRAVVIVLTQQGHATVEVGVFHARHRNQELLLKVAHGTILSGATEAGGTCRHAFEHGLLPLAEIGGSRCSARCPLDRGLKSPTTQAMNSCHSGAWLPTRSAQRHFRMPAFELAWERLMERLERCWLPGLFRPRSRGHHPLQTAGGASRDLRLRF